MTQRTAVWAAVICALLFVIVVMCLVVLSPGIPVLWLLLVPPTAAGIWSVRQAVMPDRDAPASWRVRNALGCLCAGMGVPILIMLPASEVLFPEQGPDSADRQGLGLLVLFAVLAALGAIVTLLWGAVCWPMSVATADSPPGSGAGVAGSGAGQRPSTGPERR